MFKLDFVTDDAGQEASRQNSKRHLVEHLLPRSGFCLLLSQPKGGKTTFATQLAMSVASGGLFGGLLSAHQGQVFFMSLEEDPVDIRTKLKALGPQQAVDDVRLPTMGCMPKHPRQRIPWLRHALKEHPGIKLVVVDVLQRFVETTGRYDKEYDAFAPLANLAKDAAVCILALHHLTKGSSATEDNAYGSNGVMGAATATLALRDHVDLPTVRHLKVQGRGLPLRNWRLELEDPLSMRFGLKEAPPTRKRSPEQQRLLDYLAVQDGPRSLNELYRQAWNGTHANTCQLLQKLVNAELVSQPGRGMYEITPQARMAYQMGGSTFGKMGGTL